MRSVQSLKDLVQDLEDLKIRGRMEIFSDYSIVDIGQKTEKSPGLAVTQTPVEKISVNVRLKITLKCIK